MKLPRIPNEPQHIDTNNVTKDPLWFCKECTGKDKCNQPRQGYYEWQGNIVRCKFNKRGNKNDDKITDEKYKTVEIPELDNIKKLINKHHNLYAWGEQGCGKTHFLYWLANKYNLMGAGVYISKWSEINQLIEEELKPEFRKEVSLRVKLKNVELLFIDDLGNERMTPKSAEILSTVIDHRYLNDKPTFITSNYSINELGKHWNTTKEYGQALMPYHLAKQITSRLDDINKFARVEIKGKNWRKR